VAPYIYIRGGREAARREGKDRKYGEESNIISSLELAP
jgi:hypothetical protein